LKPLLTMGLPIIELDVNDLELDINELVEAVAVHQADSFSSIL